MACFLDLPRELRDQIYGYCLLIRDPIVIQTGHSQQATAPWYWGLSRPALALLGVNRQINEEATPIYYVKNRWQMPPDYSVEPDFGFYEKHGSLIRHVIFSDFGLEMEVFGFALMQDESEHLYESYLRPEGSSLAVRRACLVRHMGRLTTLTLPLSSSVYNLGSSCRLNTLEYVWTGLLSGLIPTQHHESSIPSLKEIRSWV